MSEHTVKVVVSSNWRDSIDEAKNECNRILDIKAEDVISREDYDGFYLTSSSYSSYSTESRKSDSEFRCTRARTLRFKEYEQRADGGRQPPDSPSPEAQVWMTQESRVMASALLAKGARLIEPAGEAQETYFSRINDKIRQSLPPTAEISIKLPPFDIEFRINAHLNSFSVDAILIKNSKLKLEEREEIVGIPLSESVVRIPVSNCGTGISLELHRKVEYGYTTGFRIETERAMTDKYEISGKLSFGDYAEIGGSFSHEVSFRETQEYSSSKTESREETIDISVPPNTKADISLICQRFEARRAFEGPVTVDCNVVANYGVGDHSVSRSYALSTLLSPEERSFLIKGKYSNLDTRVMPISIAPGEC